MAESTNAEFVINRVHQSQVAFLELWTCDIRGELRGVTIASAQLEAVMDDGWIVPGAILGGSEDEVALFPDPRSYALLPWTSGGVPVARLFCDAQRLDGAPSRFDSRSVLKTTLGRATDLGYRFYVGATLHHYYRYDDGRAGTQCAFGLGTSHRGHALAREAALELERAGGAVNAISQADGPAQFLVGLEWADALSLADAVVTHRRLVCEIAQRDGVEASFEPPTDGAMPSSEMALTLSLSEANNTVFVDPLDPSGLSASAHQFKDGLARAAIAMAPLAHRRRRATKSPVPTQVITTQARATGDDRGVGLVYRGIDADANIYLVVAALLEAGLDGLRGGGGDGSGLLRHVLGEALAERIAAD